MTTKLQREAVAAVKAWCKKNKVKIIGSVRHVHPRSYVIGRLAPSCLVVSKCWADSEPHMRELDRKRPLTAIHEFDASLKEGDWCITAYVTTAGSGGRVAIRIPEPK
jgi:hypothetical protein